MDIWETNKLLLFILFVIPGFICLRTYQSLSPRSASDTKGDLLSVVVYSCLNYAILGGPIYLVISNSLQERHQIWFALFCLLVLLVAPLAWALLFTWFRRTQLAQSLLPHPTARAWDYVFSMRKPYWVIVTLTNGTRFAGKYASNSFASSDPASEQIYLEETWMLNDDGGFERPRSGTGGVLVVSKDIAGLEFFNVHLGGNDEREKETDSKRRLPTGEEGISAEP